MINILGTAIVLLIGLFILFLLSEIATYGLFISKEDEKNFLDMDYSESYLNPYDKTIIDVGSHFITNLPIGFFAKYYISDIGIIPRWSPLHNKVKTLLKTLPVG